MNYDFDDVNHVWGELDFDERLRDAYKDAKLKAVVAELKAKEEALQQQKSEETSDEAAAWWLPAQRVTPGTAPGTLAQKRPPIFSNKKIKSDRTMGHAMVEFFNDL